jgi:PKD repeat protein/glucose/arabinose dehydrogenase
MREVRAIENSLWRGGPVGAGMLAARVALCAAFGLVVLLGYGLSPARATTLPSNFQDTVVFGGLTNPVSVRFASDGRVFVAQKNGMIKEFDSFSDPTPTTVIDLGSETDDYWDRGLLGLVLDPNFPATPYMYALESYDAPIGGTAPRWNDACPTPPGPNTDGCVISGRLLRLTLSGNSVTTTKILIKDQWCQQYPSHSVGDLRFGLDGALYVSGGDGASFAFADYGQGGGSSGSPTPKNPCGDPPVPVGGSQTPPTAEGGALRSQSLRRASGEPVLLNGSVLRVDPATGDALPDNPNAASSDPNARRIVAYGFRNPFRFTFRPLTNEIWVDDVGWDSWEEVNRVPSPTTSVLNFGWPCYEGNGPQPGYQSAGLNMCTSLYNAGTATPPYYTWSHSAHMVPGDSCPTGSSSSTGIAFYTGTSNYPSSYVNGLFFADYARSCISFMPVGSSGLPDPTRVQSFASSAPNPVDLEIGPNGDLFYVDIWDGTVHEIKYSGGGNNPPIASATASPTSGNAPLTVNFDGSGSSDPDPGDTITYSWDLDGNGVYGDSTAAKPSFTYSSAGTYNASLRVTDSHSVSTTSAPITITVLSGGSSTFGTTTPGAGTDTASADLKEVSKYTAPSAVSVFKLTGYVSGLGAGTGSQPVRAVLYADSGGNPGALLGVSNAVTIVAGRAWGWVDFTFPTAVSVPAGTVWMGYIAGTTSDLMQLRYDTSTGELRYNANPYTSGPSNPFGSATLSNKHYSLYATYSTAGGNNPPVARATASPTSGSAPLAVSFDGSTSSDPDAGDTISYSWDLNGDGTFGDSTVATPSYTYTTAGTYNAVLRVADNHGASSTSSPIVITVSSSTGSSTFGTSTPGASTDTATANFKEVSKYTSPQAGNVTKVTGYVSGLGAPSGSQPVRAVIYADSGGNPGALLGVTNAVTVVAGQAWGWVDFTFPSPVAIQAGVVWMGYIAGATSDLTQLRYDPVPGELRYNTNSYTSGPSNPFGAPTLSIMHYSLYATYSSSNAPTPTITTPPSSLTWKVGDLISFSGSATDPQDGTLPSSSLTWNILLHHCDPTGQSCHIHQLQTFNGVSSGSFNAPDHGYPSYLEIQLTATDSQSLTGTTSVSLQPQTANLTFASAPTGLQLAFDGASQATPFTVAAIVGSTHSVSAPTSQSLGGTTYTFGSWSDGGAATHNITSAASSTTYTATYSSAANTPPNAVATATPTSGSAPLTVSFDGSGSSDPDAGDTITYSWDLNGDGTFADSTVANPSFTYTTAGTYNAVLKVTDSHGASTLSTPIAIIVSPATSFGTTTPGSKTDTADADYKEVSKYSAPRAGTVTKVTGYISGLGSTSGTQPVRAVIYADSSGKPGALLGVSNQIVVNAGRAWAWVDFTFPSAVSIQAGTIWIGYIAGSKTALTQLRYDTLSNDMRYNKNSGGYAAGATNPFGSTSSSNKHYSIYATYG